MSRLDKLKELERDIHELMQKANCRNYASLARQYRETLKEIEEIEGMTNGEDELDRLISG